MQFRVVTGELCGAADANAIAETRDGDLVALIHDGGYRSLLGIRDGHGERVALHRIDRQTDAQRTSHGCREAAECHDVHIATHDAFVRVNGAHAIARCFDRADRSLILKLHAEFFCHRRKSLREQMAVARLVLWQTQSTDDDRSHIGESRLRSDATFGIEQLVRNAELLQYGDVIGSAIELLLQSEQLQRTLRALVVFNSGFGAQCAQQIATVFSDRHHAALVDCIPRVRAVAQHLENPAPLRRIEAEAQHQRRMPLEQPFHRFRGHPRPCPRRGIAGRDLACIREARFERRACLTLDHRDFVSGLRQIPRRSHTDHTATENDHFHVDQHSPGWRS